jgi:hypothetical protein
MALAFQSPGALLLPLDLSYTFIYARGIER